MTSIAKVIEISAQSPESFQAAINLGLKRAQDTVQNIKSAWIKEQEVEVEDGRVTAYRIKMKVTFLLK